MVTPLSFVIINHIKYDSFEIKHFFLKKVNALTSRILDQKA